MHHVCYLLQINITIIFSPADNKYFKGFIFKKKKEKDS